MKLLIALLLLTYLFGGWEYDSDVPLMVLDGVVMERDSKKPVKPSRKAGRMRRLWSKNSLTN